MLACCVAPGCGLSVVNVSTVCQSCGAVVSTGHRSESCLQHVLIHTPVSFPFPISLHCIQKVYKTEKVGNYVQNTNGSYVLNYVLCKCVCAEG